MTMTEQNNKDEHNDADFDKDVKEKKNLTFSVSYAFAETSLKLLILAAIISGIVVFLWKQIDGRFSLFNEPVKIAVLNPSALNEQYLKAHNGNNNDYIPYIRKLMALYRSRDVLVLDMNYVITRPSSVSEISYISDTDVESELAEYGINPKMFEEKQ